jgi:transporter family protein
MNSWFFYAVGAAILYGLHQIFTKMASERISDGLGGFVVEGSAALSILIYLGWRIQRSTTGRLGTPK